VFVRLSFPNSAMDSILAGSMVFPEPPHAHALSIPRHGAAGKSTSDLRDDTSDVSMGVGAPPHLLRGSGRSRIQGDRACAPLRRERTGLDPAD
jgi:hypothetical protein